MGQAVTDASRSSTRIGIALFPGAEELDWAGPWEVLSYWARVWPADHVHVFTVAQRDGPVECAKGLRPTDFTYELLDKDREVLDWLRSLSKGGTLMTSVCTGSLVFAAAGLLDGRPATTYWSLLERLAELGDGIEVRPNDRYVDSGEVITAAGVSAGIDMALHLVRRLHSEDRAREVRRGIQYDPEPPV